MQDRVKQRARALAGSLRVMAARISDGSLVPGIGGVTDADGRPVCAFGHALVDACRNVGAQPPVLGFSNYQELEKFLDGDFLAAVQGDVIMRITWDAAKIAEWNDQAFDDQPSATPLVPVYMLNLADKLDGLTKDEETR